MDEKEKEILMEAVDKSLSDVLGNTVTHIIYKHLEDRCKIEKEEIPSKMKEFGGELEEILGAGAKIMGEKIDRNMKEALAKPTLEPLLY